MKFKDFMKSGKYVKMQAGESEVFTLNCDPFSLQSKEGRYGEVIEVRLLDENGDEKIFNVKSAATANQFAKFEEGDDIRIKKIESDDGKGRWKIVAAKAKDVADDDEEDEEEEEKPKKKKKKVVEEDDEEEDDEEEEEEKPKKKKSKKSEEVDVDDIDF